MQLPSHLSTTTLGDLLGALHRQGTTGLLELCELRTPTGSTVPGRQHRIQLRGGLVTAVETPLSAPRLGEILAREGAARADSIQRLSAYVAEIGGRRLGEVMVAARLVSQDTVERALRIQLCEKLEALFRIDEATICFHTARPLADALRRAGPLLPSDFLHGRPRARDRKSGVFPRVHAPRAEPGRASASRADAPRADPGRSAAPRPPMDDRRRRALLLLGLREGASDLEIRRAFRRLAARFHPDRAHVEAEARGGARFAELSAAYHLLVA